MGGLERSSYGAPEERLASSGVERRLEEAVVTVEIEDFDRLCREVKLSSSGFMSGGSFVIFLNVMAK